MLPCDTRPGYGQILFTYYGGGGSASYGNYSDQTRFALSRDGLKFTPLVENGAIQELRHTNDTAVLDPFLHQENSSFHMVTSNGGGSSSDMLYWHSPDAVKWSAQQTVPLMGSLRPDVHTTTAPAWIFTKELDYLIVWSTVWKPGHAHFPDGVTCDNPNLGRAAFWGMRTTDWYRRKSNPSSSMAPHPHEPSRC